jgi:hypothetical protein
MGSDIAAKRIRRGHGYHNTGTTAVPSASWNTDLEGTVKVFEDITPQTSGTVPARHRSNRSVTCVLVRNVCVSGAGGTTTGLLLPKRCVTWAAGYEGKRVDGYSKVTATDIAGVVDEYYAAAGVAVGELFWLVVKGPTEVITPVTGAEMGGADWAIHDWLYALTAVTSGVTQAGRLQRFSGVFSVTAATDGTSFLYSKGVFARALSAKTTSQTQAACLVEVHGQFRG